MREGESCGIAVGMFSLFLLFAIPYAKVKNKKESKAESIMATATLSSKGQITIPKTIRSRHHLEPGDKIEFLEDDQGVVTIWPVTQSVTKLKGMVAKPKKPISVEEMNQAIAEEGGKP